ncbi:MAG: four helix bundle protein [Verrucomicrobiota bacterium]
MPKNLRDRTYEYARRIVRLFRALPKDDVAKTLGRQLLRSGTSVGANYREAARARSTAEFIAKMGDCLKETDESDFWLGLIEDEKVMVATKLKPLRQETIELVAIFTASLNIAKRNE